MVGSRTSDGLVRKGTDVEGVLSIDNGALRIQPLLEPGWGRAGIAYGPFHREPGLSFAALLLNGHNSSQSEQLEETFRQRLIRWWIGSETYSRKSRLVRWLFGRRKQRMERQLRWWRRIRRGGPPVRKINENLAVGLFPSEAPLNPLTEGDCFVMHATGPENGELWVRMGSDFRAAVRGVQNLPICYVVVLREQGAAYYASSLLRARGFAAHPQLRPVGIDAWSTNSPVYAGIHQSVMGQIGFRLDTRVHATTVARLPHLAAWYGTAHAADDLTGSRALQQIQAAVGGDWKLCSGGFARRTTGVVATGCDNLGLLDAGAPSGLLHVLIHTPAGGQGRAGLVWRARDPENLWRLLSSGSGCELAIREKGVWSVVAQSAEWRLSPDRTHSLQILDDGATFSAHLDGHLIFGSRFADQRLATCTLVGISAGDEDGSAELRRFEAHPRTVPLPPALSVGEPWIRLGTHVAAADDFAGPPGELAGRITPTGGKVWRKEIGSGVIMAGHGTAKVQASVTKPNPGRTAYTIGWDVPGMADLEVSLTPPGSARGQKEHGTGGLIFWQDPKNYITINFWIHESYGGASISTFFQLDGFEDVYDAIWTNVGDRVSWGKATSFRTVFDGTQYVAFLDGEPVLYRALTDVYHDCAPLTIRRVGLIANWEWGNDTGSTFRDFRGRR